jgi:demethylmenaquinone methyltransferase/2-methoxy-6-polyprenyl-1,4-benzoquinol methylase
MLERARRKGLRHTVVADALRLPFTEGTFDAVTVSFGLRNMESREKSAYQYLGDSIEKFPAGEAMLSLIGQCGFAEAKGERLTGGVVSLYTAAKAGG